MVYPISTESTAEFTFELNLVESISSVRADDLLKNLSISPDALAASIQFTIYLCLKKKIEKVQNNGHFK